jgi:hypothetical protein
MKNTLTVQFFIVLAILVFMILQDVVDFKRNNKDK